MRWLSLCLAIFVLFSMLISPMMAAAQTDFGGKALIDQLTNENTGLLKKEDGPNFFTPVYVRIINLLLSIAAVSSVIFALYNGIIILGSFGNEQIMADVKRNLIFVAVGLAIIVFAFTIVNILPRFIQTGGF